MEVFLHSMVSCFKLPVASAESILKFMEMAHRVMLINMGMVTCTKLLLLLSSRIAISSV